MKKFFKPQLTERQKSFDELISSATMPRREWSATWEPRLDWSLVYELIAKVNEADDPDAAKDCLKRLKPRIKHKDPRLCYSAFYLLNVLIKKCNDPLIINLTADKWQKRLAAVIIRTQDTRLRQQCLQYISNWYHEIESAGLGITFALCPTACSEAGLYVPPPSETHLRSVRSVGSSRGSTVGSSGGGVTSSPSRGGGQVSVTTTASPSQSRHSSYQQPSYAGSNQAPGSGRGLLSAGDYGQVPASVSVPGPPSNPSRTGPRPENVYYDIGYGTGRLVDSPPKFQSSQRSHQASIPPSASRSEYPASRESFAQQRQQYEQQRQHQQHVQYQPPQPPSRPQAPSQSRYGMRGELVPSRPPSTPTRHARGPPGRPPVVATYNVPSQPDPSVTQQGYSTQNYLASRHGIPALATPAYAAVNRPPVSTAGQGGAAPSSYSSLDGYDEKAYANCPEPITYDTIRTEVNDIRLKLGFFSDALAGNLPFLDKTEIPRKALSALEAATEWHKDVGQWLSDENTTEAAVQALLPLNDELVYLMKYFKSRSETPIYADTNFATQEQDIMEDLMAFPEFVDDQAAWDALTTPQDAQAVRLGGEAAYGGVVGIGGTRAYQAQSQFQGHAVGHGNFNQNGAGMHAQGGGNVGSHMGGQMGGGPMGSTMGGGMGAPGGMPNTGIVSRAPGGAGGMGGQLPGAAPPRDPKLAQLLNMGFSAAAAAQALSYCNGDVEAALDLLVQNPEGLPVNPMAVAEDAIPESATPKARKQKKDALFHDLMDEYRSRYHVVEKSDSPFLERGVVRATVGGDLGDGSGRPRRAIQQVGGPGYQTKYDDGESRQGGGRGGVRVLPALPKDSPLATGAGGKGTSTPGESSIATPPPALPSKPLQHQPSPAAKQGPPSSGGKKQQPIVTPPKPVQPPPAATPKPSTPKLTDVLGALLPETPKPAATAPPPRPPGGPPGGPPPPPPPPPPPGAAAMKDSKTKRLHWQALKDRDINGAGNVWTAVNQEKRSVDLKELEALFARQTAQKKKAASGQKEEKSGGIIEMRRAQNIGIILARFKQFSFVDLRRKILNVDTNALSLDDWSAVHKCCPEDEELAKLAKYQANGGAIDNLCAAEQFFLAIMDVPRVLGRSEAVVLSLQFPMQVQELDKELNDLSLACQEMLNCQLFPRLLAIILDIGNFMNAGTNKAGAKGFKLAVLIKLADTRSADGKMTLLDYLVSVTQGNAPELLAFTSELPHHSIARLISQDVMNAQLEMIKNAVSHVDAELSAYTPGCTDDESFHPRMSAFRDHAIKEVQRLQAMYDQTRALYQQVAEFYGEDPSDIGAEEFFSFIYLFGVAFQSAIDRAASQREREAKRAAREKKKADAAANRAAIPPPAASARLAGGMKQQPVTPPKPSRRGSDHMYTHSESANPSPTQHSPSQHPPVTPPVQGHLSFQRRR